MRGKENMGNISGEHFLENIEKYKRERIVGDQRGKTDINSTFRKDCEGCPHQIISYAGQILLSVTQNIFLQINPHTLSHTQPYSLVK